MEFSQSANLRSLFIYISVLTLALSTTGCGDGGPATIPVTGKVTFKGTPVADGQIIFRSKTDSWAGKITNGTYTLDSTIGPKKVSITSYQSKGGGSNLESGEAVMETEQVIPEKYNDKTELSADVSSSAQEFNFDLMP